MSVNKLIFLFLFTLFSVLISLAVYNNLNNNSELIENLKDAGCCATTIECFLECYRQGRKKGEMDVLIKHRSELLEELHTIQEEIDCLDYLIYRMKKIDEEKNHK